jgi:hypothetical protein
MRWLAIALALFAFAFAGVGCGGGDDEASDDTEITVTEAGESDDTTTDETTDDSGTDTDVIPTFASEDCQGLVAAYVAISGALGSAGSQDVSGDIEKFREYAERVPEEIRADVTVLAEAYADYIEELQDLGLQAGEVPSADQLAQLQAASQSLGSSEVQAASTSVSAWTTENCSG